MKHDSMEWIQANNPYFTMNPYKPAIYKHWENWPIPKFYMREVMK